MAFADMITEVKGSVPKLSVLLAKKLVNRARKEVYDKNMWSFLLEEASWLSPAQVNTGTVSVTRGSNSITFDAAAVTALNTSNAGWSLLTQRQFRVAQGGIYSIVSLDANFAANGIATLDRIYSEQTNSGAQYLVFQCYFASPVLDLLRFLSVRDLNNVVSLFLDRYNRETLDKIDPQRMSYGVSYDVVPYLTDKRAGSATLGYKLFELWPLPNILNNWYLAYQRTGVDLILPTDALPREIQEQTVIAKAKYHAYEWAEANKGNFPEMLKTDWRFLMGAANAEFTSLWREDRRKDREAVDQWFFVRRGRIDAKTWPAYNSPAGVAFPGA
jgi:hypothetical protein